MQLASGIVKNGVVRNIRSRCVLVGLRRHSTLPGGHDGKSDDSLVGGSTTGTFSSCVADGAGLGPSTIAPGEDGVHEENPRVRHRRRDRYTRNIETSEGSRGGIGFASADMSLDCTEIMNSGKKSEDQNWNENGKTDSTNHVPSSTSPYDVFVSQKDTIDFSAVYSSESRKRADIRTDDDEFTGYIDDYGNPITATEMAKGDFNDSLTDPDAPHLDADSSDNNMGSSKRQTAVEERDANAVLEQITESDQESFPRFQSDFVDKMWCEIRAGDGGEPLHGTTRSWNLHKGPAYGGHGQDIYLKASHLLENLIDLPKKLKGVHGGDGHGTERGKNQKVRYVMVPIGTIVRERKLFRKPDGTIFRTDDGRRVYLPEFTYQFLQDGETLLVAKGGKGGVAPFTFKKNDGRKGEKGEKKRLELEYRIPTDIALLGYPSAGKSALLAALTRSHTRIGPEEFSTTRPHTGVIRFKDGFHYRITDLPGILSGAAKDKTQGRRVLRHTYRAKLLIFVIDVARKPQVMHEEGDLRGAPKGLGGQAQEPDDELDQEGDVLEGSESSTSERKGRRSRRKSRANSKCDNRDEDDQNKNGEGETEKSKEDEQDGTKKEDNSFPGDHHYKDAWEQFLQLRKEAIEFDPLNAEKPFIIVGTKGDMLHRDSLYNLDSLYFRWQGKGFSRAESDVVGVSARFGLGMSTLVRVIRSLLQNDSLEMRITQRADMGEQYRRPDYRPLLAEAYYGEEAQLALAEKQRTLLERGNPQQQGFLDGGESRQRQAYLESGDTPKRLMEA